MLREHPRGRRRAEREKQPAINILVEQMRQPGNPGGRHFGSMDRRAGLSGWYAEGKQGSRRDEAECHPERSVHELREEADPYQSEEFRGQAGTLGPMDKARRCSCRSVPVEASPSIFWDRRCRDRCALPGIFRLPFGS